MNLFTYFRDQVRQSLEEMVSSGALPSELDLSRFVVEPPRDVSHGDLATNAAMVLAKPAATNPRALAEKIAAKLEGRDEVASVAGAGPGFINMTLTDDTWRAELSAIRDAGDDYGRSSRG